jgi:hypothetical protein
MSEKLEVSTVKPEISFSIDGVDLRILDVDSEFRLDSSIDSIRTFMSNTNGVGKTDEQKDMDYANAQVMWKSYQQDLRVVKFNFNLDRSQYTLLTDILLKKLEYGVDNIFIAIELTELLSSMHGTKYNDDNQIKSFACNATEITYIYHLIQTYKVKGITKETYTFSKILLRIGEISKLVSYYDANAKNLTKDIAEWALTLDGNDGILEEIDEKITL